MEKKKKILNYILSTPFSLKLNEGMHFAFMFNSSIASIKNSIYTSTYCGDESSPKELNVVHNLGSIAKYREFYIIRCVHSLLLEE